jgi:2-polyprenyl-6-hydroxyphenyl methylase/3-demethylubiquinone-9 3-methyltransferase
MALGDQPFSQVGADEAPASCNQRFHAVLPAYCTRRSVQDHRLSSSAVTAPRQAGDNRFAFGRNWTNFLDHLSEERVRDAEASIRGLLGVEDLRGRSFLDIGCGSGLFSLAALRLGAERVHSFDFDPDSVSAAERLRHVHAGSASWTIERGDVLDPAYVDALGPFDVVYAWGVLHHTGAMWTAIANASVTVGEVGVLALAIYNDQGGLSGIWHVVKRLYNHLPRPVRTAYALLVAVPLELRSLAGAIARGRPISYWRSWTGGLERGMSRWHDLLDWVGGYPFEVATPAEVLHFLRDRGFALRELSTVGGSHGCNEFVFERRESPAPSPWLAPAGGMAPAGR